MLAVVVFTSYQFDQLLEIGQHTWRGIVLGQTKQKGVFQQLGKPTRVISCAEPSKSWFKNIEDCLEGLEIYEYDEFLRKGKAPATHRLYFKQNTIWLIEETGWLHPNAKNLQLENLIKRYGLPEKITWSGLSHGQRVIMFCEQGFIIHANTSDVYKIFHFAPKSLEACLKIAELQVRTHIPDLPPDVRLAPENPWGIDTLSD